MARLALPPCSALVWGILRGLWLWLGELIAGSWRELTAAGCWTITHPMAGQRVISWRGLWANTPLCLRREGMGESDRSFFKKPWQLLMTGQIYRERLKGLLTTRRAWPSADVDQAGIIPSSSPDPQQPSTESSPLIFCLGCLCPLYWVTSHAP